MMKDVENMKDIKFIVDNFYSEVREDDLIGEVFKNVIGDKWPEHLDKMYRFWQTVVLNEHTYQGSPFVPHAPLPVSKEHFNRWLFLFNKTIDDAFIGEKAEKMKWQGQRMAEMFHSKIEYYRNNSITPLL